MSDNLRLVNAVRAASTGEKTAGILKSIILWEDEDAAI